MSGAMSDLVLLVDDILFFYFNHGNHDELGTAGQGVQVAHLAQCAKLAVDHPDKRRLFIISA
jgi:hypothetical protein